MSSAMSAIALIKQKAENLNISHKAQEVAHLLGNEIQKKHGSWWRFDDKRIGIEYDDYGHNLDIVWGGQRVFGTQTGQINRAYLQTEWMNHLANLFYASQQVRNEQDKQIEGQVAKEEGERWKDETDINLGDETKPYNPNAVDKETFEKVVNYVREAVWTKEPKK